jgi:hypothetical protein
MCIIQLDLNTGFQLVDPPREKFGCASHEQALSHNVVSSTPSIERDSNAQR